METLISIMRVFRAVQYVVYVAALSFFYAMGSLLMEAAVRLTSGKGLAFDRDALAVVDFAGFVVPYVICQVVVAVLAVRRLSLRKLFVLSAICAVASYPLLFLLSQIPKGMLRRMHIGFSGNILVGQLLPLLIPVLILALAERRRSASESGPKGETDTVLPRPESVGGSAQEQCPKSQALPERRWYRWDIALAVLPLCYAAILDPLGIINYIGGLVNEQLLFSAVFALVFLLPVALGCLGVLVVRMFAVWPRRIHGKGRLLLCWAAAVGGFAACFVLPFVSLLPPPYEMYTRGFRRHVQLKTDVGAIQTWLSTLDPKDCQDQPLDMKVAPGLSYPNPPKSIPSPECVSRLRPRYSKLTRDDKGRPMIRLTWGGGFGHWGLVVGDKDMEIPETQERTGQEYGPPDRPQVVYAPGEYRLPLAPGAYIWYELQ